MGKYFISRERQAEMLGRAATELAIHLLGGQHRLNPSNMHQVSRVALVNTLLSLVNTDNTCLSLVNTPNTHLSLVRYEGDPDTRPITGREVVWIVRGLHQLSASLNTQYGLR